MRNDDVLREMLSRSLGSYQGPSVGIDVRVEDADVERLIDANMSAAYWACQCRGRYYQYSTEAEALARLCRRPPNRSMLRSVGVKDDEPEPQVRLEYLVWRE